MLISTYSVRKKNIHSHSHVMSSTYKITYVVGDT